MKSNLGRFGRHGSRIILLCAMASLLTMANNPAQAVSILLPADYVPDNPSFTSSAPISTDDPPGPNTYNYSGGASATWDFDLLKDATTLAPVVFTPGVYKLEISWGVYTTHSTNLNYILDNDGFGVGANTLGIDQTLIAAAVNQAQFANGAAAEPGVPRWSGFRNTGVYSLNANSELRMLQMGTGPTTIAVLQLTSVPEPSTVVMLVLGLGGMIAAPRLRRKFAAKRTCAQ